MQRTGQQNTPCNVERGSQRRAALGGDWERSASTLAQKLGQHMDTHVLFGFCFFLLTPDVARAAGVHWLQKKVIKSGTRVICVLIMFWVNDDQTCVKLCLLETTEGTYFRVAQAVV